MPANAVFKRHEYAVVGAASPEWSSPDGVVVHGTLTPRGSVTVQFMVPAGMKSPLKQSDPASRAVPDVQLYVVVGVAAIVEPVVMQLVTFKVPAPTGHE